MTIVIITGPRNLKGPLKKLFSPLHTSIDHRQEIVIAQFTFVCVDQKQHIEASENFEEFTTRVNGDLPAESSSRSLQEGEKSQKCS
jgi:hypothetical protein